jgi:hypothetical protein
MSSARHLIQWLPSTMNMEISSSLSLKKIWISSMPLWCPTTSTRKLKKILKILLKSMMIVIPTFNKIRVSKYKMRRTLKNLQIRMRTKSKLMLGLFSQGISKAKQISNHKKRKRLMISRSQHVIWNLQ